MFGLLLALALQDLQSAPAGALVLKLPKDWEIVKEEKTLLTALSPIEGPADTFRENLRVEAFDVEAGTTIDAAFGPSIKALEKGDGGMKLVAKGSLNANGHKVLWMAVRPKQPAPGADALTMVDYGLVHAGKAYALHLLVADDKVPAVRARFEGWLKTLEPKAGK